MEKKTLKFQCLIKMASFSKQLSSGYLMNTNNFTITGRFSEEELSLALDSYGAVQIETSDKVFTYENL
jgi:hypothetical protein